MAGWTLGIVGGSGLDDIEGLEDRAILRIDGPFGAPSGNLTTGRIGTTRLVFLPRHGPGHAIPPVEINAGANIDALKRAGCTDVLSLSAVGSLREDLPPGTFVVVDLYIERTVGRPSSFFGTGLAAHVSMADPVCPRPSGLALPTTRDASPIDTCLDAGIITASEARDPALMARLDAVAGRVLRGSDHGQRD